jgi:hypothetical protein
MERRRQYHSGFGRLGLADAEVIPNVVWGR